MSREIKNADKKQLSKLIRFFKNNTNYTVNDLAEILEISSTYFNNKLHRNSFSFEDVVKVSKICNYEFIVLNKTTGDVFRLDELIKIDTKEN